MQLRMWTYDLAREQAPTYEHLREFAEVSLRAGYNALGLYLEHRFAYPSAPWAAGKCALTPEDATRLTREFPDLMIIPFVNLLGHFEGFLYSEEGAQLAEERFSGLQACPSKPLFVDLAKALLNDVLEIFPSGIVHIGGDETAQLGRCPRCASVSKSELYGNHFAPLAQHVLEAGRRPAIWGDMFAEHPDALSRFPKETLIFDWQYFQSPLKSAAKFVDAGYEVVLCPTLQTYNAAWLHLGPSEQNIRDHVAVASSLGAYGVCVTTWEQALFGNYEALLPAIEGAGSMLLAEAPPADSSAKQVPPTDAKFPIYDANPQLTDPNLEEEFPSITTGITNSILMQMLDDKVSELSLVPNEDSLVVGAGQIPLENGRSVLQRLLLLAGCDILKRRQPLVGAITGSYRGERFELKLQSFPVDHDLEVTLRYADPAISPIGLIGLMDGYRSLSDAHADWARLMGIDLPAVGGIFGHSQTRSALKCRFLLYSNPFLLWLHHREELCGKSGDDALAILEKAIAVAPNSAYRGVSEFVKLAIEFVRQAEKAHQAYAARKPGEAAAALAPARTSFDQLATIAKATHLRIGGSLADIERCQTAKEHVERVMVRIKRYGDGSLGYLPSFETLAHPKFVPHDQGDWWLINKWANE